MTPEVLSSYSKPVTLMLKSGWFALVLAMFVDSTPIDNTAPPESDYLLP